MKLVKKLNGSKIALAFCLVMVVAVFGSSVAVAAEYADKTTEKAREAVASAAPHDWQTLAQSAEQCIKKRVNMKEAAVWLDSSLKIKETPFNLSLKGDYYYVNNLPELAMPFYVKALQLGKKNDFYFDGSELQQKINKTRAYLN